MEEIEKIKELSKPILKLLQEEYNPHTTVIINTNNIRVVTDKIEIPINKF